FTISLTLLFVFSIYLNVKQVHAYNANDVIYTQTQTTCAAVPLTANQLCQQAGYPGTTTAFSTVSQGYYWRECAGASISSCNGLSCTVNALDCDPPPTTPDEEYWRKQNPQFDGSPYPASYILPGTNSTTYPVPPCPGLNQGWTVRLACIPWVIQGKVFVDLN